MYVFGPRLPQCLYRRNIKLSGPLGNNPCVKDDVGRQRMVCGARGPQSAMHDDGMCPTSLRTLAACQWKEIPKLYATLAQTSFPNVVAGSVWPSAFGALRSACQHVLVVGIVFRHFGLSSAIWAVSREPICRPTRRDGEKRKQIFQPSCRAPVHTQTMAIGQQFGGVS